MGATDVVWLRRTAQGFTSKERDGENVTRFGGSRLVRFASHDFRLTAGNSLAADTIGFLLGFPLITPISPLTTLGTAVLGFLGFVTHQRRTPPPFYSRTQSSAHSRFRHSPVPTPCAILKPILKSPNASALVSFACFMCDHRLGRATGATTLQRLPRRRVRALPAPS